MPGSFRLLALVVALSGCAFDPPEGGATPDETQDPDRPIPPPKDPPARLCGSGSSDPDLVLCLDFQADPLGFDSSDSGLTAAVVNVRSVERVVGEQAVLLSGASRVLVPDDPALDVQDYTVEMWIRPDSISGLAALFDNYNQYAMRLDRGDVTCGLNSPVKSDNDDTLPADEWSHVACRYSGGQMKVFLNGYVSECKNYPAASTGGVWGASVGARITDLTTVDMNFVGGVDNVRVYKRAIDEAELCAAAGQTPGSCSTKCPDNDGPGPGGGGDD